MSIWATAFSSMVRNDPVYFDTRGEGLVLHNLENPDEDYGIFTGRDMSEPISEYLVASLFWDFFDAEADGDDTIHIDVQVLAPLLGYLDNGERRHRGSPGVDFVDYLDGSVCLDIIDPDALALRLGEAQFPYEERGRECEKPSSPVGITPSSGWLDIEARRPFDAMEVRHCTARGCQLVEKVLAGSAPSPVRQVVDGWVDSPHQDPLQSIIEGSDEVDGLSEAEILDVLKLWNRNVRLPVPTMQLQ